MLICPVTRPPAGRAKLPWSRFYGLPASAWGIVLVELSIKVHRRLIQSRIEPEFFRRSRRFTQSKKFLLKEFPCPFDGREWQAGRWVQHTSTSTAGPQPESARRFRLVETGPCPSRVFGLPGCAGKPAQKSLEPFEAQATLNGIKAASPRDRSAPDRGRWNRIW